MYLRAFCFLDIKTGCYSQPFFMLHNAAAVRAAMDVGNDLATSIGRHPFDFRLVRIGEFDDSVGFLLSVQHEDLGTVGSILAQAELSRPAKNPSEMTASEVVELRQSQSA